MLIAASLQVKYLYKRFYSAYIYIYIYIYRTLSLSYALSTRAAKRAIESVFALSLSSIVALSPLPSIYRRSLCPSLYVCPTLDAERERPSTRERERERESSLSKRERERALDAPSVLRSLERRRESVHRRERERESERERERELPPSYALSVRANKNRQSGRSIDARASSTLTHLPPRIVHQAMA
jgi:hypothetical protein